MTTRRILAMMAGVLLIGACSQKDTPPIPDNKTQPNVSTQPNNNAQSNPASNYDYMKGKTETEYF